MIHGCRHEEDTVKGMPSATWSERWGKIEKNVGLPKRSSKLVHESFVPCSEKNVPIVVNTPPILETSAQN